MHRTRQLVALFTLTALPFVSGPAAAVLTGEISGLEATGRVDLDGFGPQPPVSNTLDTEFAPFARSIVSVSDTLPGVFSYAASADIGNQALRVAGSVTNGTASNLGEGEVAVLSASAQALDILTLTAEAPAVNVPVTMELIVNGVLSSGFVRANSSLSFGVLGELNGSDFGSYSSGPVSDVLTVTRMISFSEQSLNVSMDFNTRLLLAIMRVDPGQTVSGDLGNTALLRLILPAGVSLTASESGTFGVPLPIPEPQTYALMLAGFALLAFKAMRRAGDSGKG